MKYLSYIILIIFRLAISQEDIYNSSWALIIGINKYDNVSNLHYAIEDAESIQNILINTLKLLTKYLLYSKINIINKHIFLYYNIILLLYISKLFNNFNVKNI